MTNQIRQKNKKEVERINLAHGLKQVEQATLKDELFARAQAKALEIKASKLSQNELTRSECVVYDHVGKRRTPIGMMKDLERVKLITGEPDRRSWLSRRLASLRAMFKRPYNVRTGKQGE